MPGVIRGCWCRDWRGGGGKTEYPGTAEGYREICQRSLDKWQVKGTALPEQGEDKQRQQVRSSEQTEGVALPITRYFTASQDQPFSFRSSLRGAAASTRGCGIKKLRDGFLVGMGRRSRSGGDTRSCKLLAAVESITTSSCSAPCSAGLGSLSSGAEHPNLYLPAWFKQAACCECRCWAVRHWAARGLRAPFEVSGNLPSQQQSCSLFCYSFFKVI